MLKMYIRRKDSKRVIKDTVNCTSWCEFVKMYNKWLYERVEKGLPLIWITKKGRGIHISRIDYFEEQI